jgi:hypothetical protein
LPVVCPPGQVCQNASCEDACAHIACPPPGVCDSGECRPPCSCARDCAPGQACDLIAGICVPAGCLGMICPAGQRCNNQGQCVGVCEGVRCPTHQKCVETHGGCVASSTDVQCPEETVWDINLDTCARQCSSPICASVADGGASEAAPGTNIPFDDSGRPACGCRAGNREHAGGPFVWAVILCGGFLVRRNPRKRDL